MIKKEWLSIYRFKLALIFISVLLSIVSCDDTSESKSELIPDVDDSQPLREIDLRKADSVSRRLWAYSRQSIEKSNKLLISMKSAKSSFLINPSAANLSLVREELASAHQALQHSAWISMLPATAPDIFSRHKVLWTNVDQWPYEPGFIDSYGAYPFSGIVNDAVLELNEKNLRAQNMITDDSEVILGYHSVGFLLAENLSNDFDDTGVVESVRLDEGSGLKGKMNEDIGKPRNDERRVTVSAKPKRHLDYLVSVEMAGKESAINKAVVVGIERRRAVLDLTVELLLADSQSLLRAVSQNGLLARQYIGLAPIARLALIKESAGIWLEKKVIPRLESLTFGSGVPAEIITQLEALVFIVVQLNESGVYKIPMPFTVGDIERFAATGGVESKEVIKAKLLQLRKQLGVDRVVN